MNRDGTGSQDQGRKVTLLHPAQLPWAATTRKQLRREEEKGLVGVGKIFQTSKQTWTDYSFFRIPRASRDWMTNRRGALTKLMESGTDLLKVWFCRWTAEILLNLIFVNSIFAQRAKATSTTHHLLTVLHGEHTYIYMQGCPIGNR